MQCHKPKIIGAPSVKE